MTAAPPRRRRRATPIVRADVEDAIGRLIEVLDALDGDADLEDDELDEDDGDDEPDADDEDSEGDCDREDGGDDEPSGDEREPWLGAPEPVTAQETGDGGQLGWARGMDDDCEATGTIDDIPTYAPGIRTRAAAEAIWAIERDAHALASRLRRRRRPVTVADRHGALARGPDGRLYWLRTAG